MNNPFVGMTVGAWLVFLLTCGVADFKWWAGMLWVPWLTFATLAPVVWWLNQRMTAGRVLPDNVQSQRGAYPEAAR